MSAIESSDRDRLVFFTRRAYEAGEVRLLLRTDAVCDNRDTGWQLLHGDETGLELANPENSLLVSVQRALTMMPELTPILTDESQPMQAAYTFDVSSRTFLPTEMPEDLPTQ